MGSGGLRGLQILRSGVQSVRGGFDSHAFPPSRLRVALLAALLLAGAVGPVTAQPPGPPPAALDSLAARPPAPSPPLDSLAARPSAPSPARDSLRAASAAASAAGDSAAATFDLRRYRVAPMDSTRYRFHRGRFDAPRWVMMRSLVVPGWGQLHNGSWLKALLLGGGEVAVIVGIVQDNHSLDGLKTAADLARVEADDATYAAAVQRYNDRLDRLTSREWLLGGVLVYALADAFVDAHFRDFKIEFEYDPALPGGSSGGGAARVAVGWAF
jgi:hypothetical protein